jgi:ornithine cyclodeaminase
MAEKSVQGETGNSIKATVEARSPQFERIPPYRETERSDLHIVNAAELQRLVPMDDVIEIVSAAMIRLSSGSISSPERWVERVASNGLMGLMPGASDDGPFGVKVLSLFTASARQGLPGHQGMMLTFDGETGKPLSVIEASALTALRTAAASAAATRAMARQGASSMALIGCGEQAIWHARALPLVRPIETVHVWARNRERAAAFADRHLAHIARVVIAPSVETAVSEVDIISTLTHSDLPILLGRWLKPGQHLNLVGSSRAEFREIDAEAVVRARFVADSREHVLSQGGELRQAMQAGLVDQNHIVAEIGEVLNGRVAGRTDENEITIYKSLGHIAQDLAVANAIHEKLKNVPGECRVAWR